MIFYEKAGRGTSHALTAKTGIDIFAPLYYNESINAAINDVIVDFSIKIEEKDKLKDNLEKNKIRTNSLSYLEKCFFEELA